MFNNNFTNLVLNNTPIIPTDQCKMPPSNQFCNTSQTVSANVRVVCHFMALFSASKSLGNLGQKILYASKHRNKCSANANGPLHYCGDNKPQYATVR